MEKKGTKIAYFVALGLIIVLLVVLGLSFKDKENPVFIGSGTLVAMDDGTYMDGDENVYVKDGDSYVSTDSKTFFSFDGDKIVMADGTEYVLGEDGVTYEEQAHAETPFAGTFWSLLPPSWPSCWL